MTWKFIHFEDDRIPFTLRNFDRNNFLFKAAGLPLLRVRAGTDYNRAAARIIAKL